MTPMAIGRPISLLTPSCRKSGKYAAIYLHSCPADISMAGGMLQIDIPAGWTPLKIVQDKGSGGTVTDH